MTTKPVTPFPLGAEVGGPNGSDATAEAGFESQFASFTQLMGTAPSFMNAYVDQSQPISSWAGNAGWTAWSWAQSPDAKSEIPVIGLPMAPIADAANPDADYKAFASGQYDSVLKGIVSAWSSQGFKTLYFRPGWEMNVPQSPSYAGTDPTTQADWIAAFQHISTVLHSVPGANVQVVWNPNVQSWNAVGNVLSLYPGSKYVDVIGADMYSPQYPRDLYDWSLNNGTYDSSFAQWMANPVNRIHYWNEPAANRWTSNDQQGNSLSLQQLLDFAKAQGKPFAMGETGAGSGGNGNQGPEDDPAFPQWLASTLASSGDTIAFANVWDLWVGDGNWAFTGSGADKPLEAQAWQQAFGVTQPVVTPPAAGGGASTAVTIGTGAGSVVLQISEDAWQGDAQFTVSVDGTQIGGTQTANASHAAGQDQAFTVLGNFSTGSHVVSVSFLNDAWGGTAATDRNLYVDSVSYAGTTNAVKAVLLSNGAQSFTVGNASGPVTIGTGPGSIVLQVSEDAWLGDAQFIVSVDGTQIGGTQIATASHGAGLDQAFTVQGNFSTGSHAVSVNFLNDAWGGTAATDRNLYVDSLSYGGFTNPVKAALLSNGAQTFMVASAPAPVVIGTGPNSMALQISEDAWLGDAQFSVSVDGQQVGGTQTATASHAAGQDQSFTVQGSFAAGKHVVSVNFLNDAWGGTAATDRNLYVDSVAYNGVTNTMHAALMSNGAQAWTVGTAVVTSAAPSSAVTPITAAVVAAATPSFVAASAAPLASVASNGVTQLPSLTATAIAPLPAATGAAMSSSPVTGSFVDVALLPSSISMPLLAHSGS